MNTSIVDEFRKKLTNHYRLKWREFMRVESRRLKTPTEELSTESFRLEGYCAGVKKSIDILEARANDNEFDFPGPA